MGVSRPDGIVEAVGDVDRSVRRRHGHEVKMVIV
jgi:hypothetical protein